MSLVYLTIVFAILVNASYEYSIDNTRSQIPEHLITYQQSSSGYPTYMQQPNSGYPTYIQQASPSISYKQPLTSSIYLPSQPTTFQSTPTYLQQNPAYLQQQPLPTSYGQPLTSQMYYPDQPTTFQSNPTSAYNPASNVQPVASQMYLASQPTITHSYPQQISTGNIPAMYQSGYDQMGPSTSFIPSGYGQVEPSTSFIPSGYGQVGPSTSFIPSGYGQVRPSTSFIPSGYGQMGASTSFTQSENNQQTVMPHPKQAFIHTRPEYVNQMSNYPYGNPNVQIYPAYGRTHVTALPKAVTTEHGDSDVELIDVMPHKPGTEPYKNRKTPTIKSIELIHLSRPEKIMNEIPESI